MYQLLGFIFSGLVPRMSVTYERTARHVAESFPFHYEDVSASSKLMRKGDLKKSHNKTFAFLLGVLLSFQNRIFPLDSSSCLNQRKNGRPRNRDFLPSKRPFFAENGEFSPKINEKSPF